MLDLHVHTVFSDGELTPAEVVAMARATGLEALAVTDHDTLDGLSGALQAGREAGQYVVTGVEFSVDTGLHMLGYAFDPNDAALNAKVQWTREMRGLRNVRMLNKLREHGFELSLDEVTRESGGGVLGRAHMALALTRKGYASSPRDAFDRLIGSDGPAYVPKIRMTAPEAISLIRGAGGYAVWAHPLLQYSINDCLSKAAALAADGLSGMEVYYPAHDPEQTRALLNICRSLNLFATAGSDFHGPRVKPEVRMGFGWSDHPLPEIRVPFLPQGPGK